MTKMRVAYLTMQTIRLEESRNLSVKVLTDLDDSFSEETRAKLEQANALLWEVEQSVRAKFDNDPNNT